MSNDSRAKQIYPHHRQWHWPKPAAKLSSEEKQDLHSSIEQADIGSLVAQYGVDAIIDEAWQQIYTEHYTLAHRIGQYLERRGYLRGKLVADYAQRCLEQGTRYRFLRKRSD